MAQLKSKAAPVVIAVAVILFGLAIALAYQKGKDTSNKPPANAATNHASQNPTDVVPQLSSLNNQSVTLKGRIQQYTATDYYIVGDGKQPGAIKLDFSKSKVNAADYANPTITNDPQTTGKIAAKGPVTVTGKITQPTASGQYVLVVQSVK
jgi:uncharacterized protein YdeI (BOF family)